MDHGGRIFRCVWLTLDSSHSRCCNLCSPPCLSPFELFPLMCLRPTGAFGFGYGKFVPANFPPLVLYRKIFLLLLQWCVLKAPLLSCGSRSHGIERCSQCFRYIRRSQDAHVRPRTWSSKLASKACRFLCDFFISKVFSLYTPITAEAAEHPG